MAQRSTRRGRSRKRSAVGQSTAQLWTGRQLPRCNSAFDFKPPQQTFSFFFLFVENCACNAASPPSTASKSKLSSFDACSGIGTQPPPTRTHSARRSSNRQPDQLTRTNAREPTQAHQDNIFFSSSSANCRTQMLPSTSASPNVSVKYTPRVLFFFLRCRETEKKQKQYVSLTRNPQHSTTCLPACHCLSATATVENNTSSHHFLAARPGHHRKATHARRAQHSTP